MKPKRHHAATTIAVFFLLSGCALSSHSPSMRTQPEPSPAIPNTPTLAPNEPSPSSPEQTPYTYPLDDTIPPFSIEECVLEKVRIGETKVSELAEAIGVTESELESEAEEIWNHFHYDDVTFTSNPREGSDKFIDSITITGDVVWKTPRNIKVGDTFESVLLKFPRERQYAEDPDGYFYGDVRGYESNVPSGYVSTELRGYVETEYKIIVLTTSGWADPFMKIYFHNDTVTEIFYGYPGN